MNQNFDTRRSIYQLPRGQIEMIEVYTSPARGQAEFVGNSCGAIMIWTR